MRHYALNLVLEPAMINPIIIWRLKRTPILFHGVDRLEKAID